MERFKNLIDLSGIFQSFMSTMKNSLLELISTTQMNVILQLIMYHYDSPKMTALQVKRTVYKNNI